MKENEDIHKDLNTSYSVRAGIYTCYHIAAG